MTTPEPASYPIYTETTLDDKGVRHAQSLDLADVPVETLVFQMQHGDVRAADEIKRRAFQAGLDSGDLTQDQVDFLNGLTDTPPPGMDVPPPDEESPTTGATT